MWEGKLSCDCVQSSHELRICIARVALTCFSLSRKQNSHHTNLKQDEDEEQFIDDSDAEPETPVS